MLSTFEEMDYTHLRDVIRRVRRRWRLRVLLEGPDGLGDATTAGRQVHKIAVQKAFGFLHGMADDLQIAVGKDLGHEGTEGRGAKIASDNQSSLTHAGSFRKISGVRAR